MTKKQRESLTAPVYRSMRMRGATTGREQVTISAPGLLADARPISFAYRTTHHGQLLTMGTARAKKPW